MGSFVSSCKCTHLRDECTAFLSSYFIIRENSSFFQKGFPKVSWKGISLNWLIQVKTKSQHCSLNHVKGDKGLLLSLWEILKI